MNRTARVLWLGDVVAAKIAAAAEAAVNESTRAAAEDARSSHWWQRQTGNLDANIISETATVKAGRIVGKFGSSLRRGGFYGLFLERRAPFLRPAADRHFPKLPSLIKRGTHWT